MTKKLIGLGAVLFLLAWLFPAIPCRGDSTSTKKNRDESPAWDVSSDTWVATDRLGRTLPMQSQTGSPRKDRSIGMFYFLWNGRHGEAGPYDVTKILAQDPDAMAKKDSPLWGDMHVPHHWGESIFHYYVGEDESVLRKHAQMLGDAGVDVVIFDVTNQLTYPESYQALCKVFHEVRAAGNHAPQIAFLAPFGSPKKVVHELWNDLYSKGEYRDLWYQWRGKPLIMADPALIIEDVTQERTGVPQELFPGNLFSQTFETKTPFFSVSASVPTWMQKDSAVTMILRRGGLDGKVVKTVELENLDDCQWNGISSKEGFAPGEYTLEMTNPRGKVGWWHAKELAGFSGKGFVDGKPVDNAFAIRITTGGEQTQKILDFFTFRKPQPDYFVGPTGPNQWSWLEVYPQHPFYVLDKTGEKVPEQMAVGTAQNAVAGKLSVLSNPRAHGRSFHNGSEPAPEQCDTTGRNFQEQWSRAFEVDPPFIFVTGWNEWIMGRFDENSPFYGSGVVSFVDQFNEEFSRDIEPVIGGHGDDYYYQLISNIRRYKGTRPLQPVKSGKIAIDRNFADWESVSPEFRDTIGDPVHRNERGWGAGTRYTNETGRNDIIASKVSADSDNLYFYVQTAEPMVGCDDSNWMLLYINADADYNTGWLGYDFVINRNAIKFKGHDALTQLESVVIEKHDSAAMAAQLAQNSDDTISGDITGSPDHYRWTAPVEVPARGTGNEMEIAIPLSVFGGKLPKVIDFKWSDNVTQTGEWSDFTINGDVAPNDRYNFRAKF